MKILYGSFYDACFSPSGVFTQVLKTKEYIEKLGHQVDLFDQWKKVSASNYDFFHIFVASIKNFSLARAAKDAGFKIAISPIFFRTLNPFVIRLELALFKNVPRIYTDHKAISDMLNLASIVLPNTNKEAEYICKAFGIPKEKIHVVPNGVDAKFFNADPNLFISRYKLSDFILSAGSCPRKNFDKLISISKDLKRHLVLIGKNDNNSFWKGLEDKSKNNPFVTFVNAIDHNAPMLASAYAAAEIFALPSDFETPGLAALEAALAGAKIVITSVGGTDEYFSDYVEYVNPKIADSIKAGIERAFKRPKNELLKNHILENFSWDVVASKTLEAYQTLL